MDIVLMGTNRGRSNGHADEISFQSFIDMETLSDRLTLLNYEEYVINILKMRLINRHYFALQTNSGEQFFMFTSLAVWLLNKLGSDLKQPHEFDDPNITINNILEHCSNLDLFTDIPINQLKQGFGKHIITVLNGLAELVIRKNKFIFNKPNFPSEKDVKEEIDENNAELLLDHVEEEMIWVDSSSDEENIINLNELSNLNKIKRTRNKMNSNLKVPTTNKEEWNMEVEQVLPLLRLTIKLDSKDWRANLHKMNEYKLIMDKTLKVIKPLLNNLHDKLEETIEKVYSREKYLNSTLDSLLIDYRNSQVELALVSEQYESSNNGIMERQELLTKITEQLDVVKQEMDERGLSMTDGTPLINIKKAISEIKTDIMKMDVRIGILQHGYLVSKMHNKTVIQNITVRMKPLFTSNKRMS
ncbi:intraflagellar transport protein 57 homolog isoform X3 [Daktulosphaira vitifoliae]|uniref:intraflagellar transport protein 57 homolog isoform X3 n=1 Tax=Daktulosphaira vitifoliae TaxID=58002 RepID=UPI0021A9A03B|nr:intraflagellar transport protein 57 homolog isoform X3 [Daktulosphaira vitifoliae]